LRQSMTGRKLLRWKVRKFIPITAQSAHYDGTETTLREPSTIPRYKRGVHSVAHCFVFCLVAFAFSWIGSYTCL